MRILNLGCGEDTYGTDFCDIYPSREEVVKIDIEKSLPYKDNTFDEVYMRCIFEHLKNPNSTLKDVRRVLKKNGKIVVITDNGACWMWHTPFIGSYSKQHYTNSVRMGEDDRHYYIFTPLHLKNHMESAGFGNTKTKYEWFYYHKTSLVNTILFFFLSLIGGMLTLFPRFGYPHIRCEAVK